MSWAASQRAASLTPMSSKIFSSFSESVLWRFLGGGGGRKGGGLGGLRGGGLGVFGGFLRVFWFFFGCFGVFFGGGVWGLFWKKGGWSLGFFGGF